MNAIEQRARELFDRQRQTLWRRTDRLFAALMVFQWLLGLGFALWISPQTWEGTLASTHIHVWAAVFVGGAIAALPVALTLTRPGSAATRQAIAVGQMLTSALLIHLTGGRIETHFHVFGSLAFLAFYRDWRVLLTASSVVLLDHLGRGLFWPQSVYGVLSATPWRALEHAAWVLFEDIVLIASSQQGLREMRAIAERQAGLELVNADVERQVVDRTAELRASEATLKASEQRFRALVEHSSEGILLVSREARILYASDSAARMLGRSVSDLVGAEALSLGHPEELEHAWGRFGECLAHPGREVRAEYRFPHPDGSCHTMEAVSVNRFEEPAVGAVVVNFKDVTLRKQAEEALSRSEEQLRQAQKMEAIGRLAGGVAHDFNNLLAVIIGYGQLLRKHLPAGDRLQAKVGEILKAGERAATLTQQLLTFSRKGVRQPKVMNLNSVVTEMGMMLRRVIGEDLELRMLLGTDLGLVRMDPGQAEQVIMNLAVNARDAMVHGGRLTIETANVHLDDEHAAGPAGPSTRPFVRLQVSDTGVGMDAETQSRIFEPFFTTKERGKGTGLGLATVYAILQQNGGHVFVQSELGRGTTFTLYLPMVGEPTEPAARPERAEQAPRGSETVLLVEDEEAVRNLAREILEASGYTVIEAGSGAEAIRLRHERKAPVHLLLTDVVMPGMSGPQLAERLAPLGEMSVLYMSGYAEGALAHQGLVESEVTMLQKPFTPDDLARKVRQVLDVGASARSWGGSDPQAPALSVVG